MADTAIAPELESYHWVEQLACSLGQKKLVKEEVAALHLQEQPLQESTGQNTQQAWNQNLDQKGRFHCMQKDHGLQHRTKKNFSVRISFLTSRFIYSPIHNAAQFSLDLKSHHLVDQVHCPSV